MSRLLQLLAVKYFELKENNLSLESTIKIIEKNNDDIKSEFESYKLKVSLLYK